MVTGLHTLIAQVSDMDRAVEFYRDTLGFSSTYISPHWSSFQVGGTTLGLHPLMNGSTPGSGSSWITCWNVEDIRSFRARLESAGIACSDYHDTPSGAIFNFSDPDGNAMQAMEPGTLRKDLVL